jgi:hypothetical protein
VEKLKPTLAKAGEAGITIVIENHGNGLMESPDSVRWLADLGRDLPLGIRGNAGKSAIRTIWMWLRGGPVAHPALRFDASSTSIIGECTHANAPRSPSPPGPLSMA